MDRDTKVFCTSCINIKVNLTCLERKEGVYCSKCPCYGCECAYPEDSYKFEDRPNYVVSEKS